MSHDECGKQFASFLSTETFISPSSSTSQDLSREIKTRAHKGWYSSFQSNLLHNSPKLETTHMFVHQLVLG